MDTFLTPVITFEELLWKVNGENHLGKRTGRIALESERGVFMSIKKPSAPHPKHVEEV